MALKWQRRGLRAAAEPAAALCIIILLLAFLAQAGYALHLHAVDPCEADVMSSPCEDKLLYFGSARAEVVASWALAGVSLPIAALWVALRLRYRLPPWLRSCRALRLAVRDLRLAGQRVVRRLLWRVDEDAETRRIRREYELARMSRVRNFISKSAVCFFLGSLQYTCHGFFIELSKSSTHKLTYWRYLFAGEGLSIIPLGCVVFFLDMCPFVVTPRVVDLLNALVSCLWAWRFAIATTASHNFTNHWIIASRVLQGATFGNAPLSVALNVGLYCIGRVNEYIRPQVNNTRPFMTEPDPRVWGRDLFVLVLLCLFCLLLERSRWGEAKLVVLTKKSDQSATLISQLLDGICDAVPRLDADLRLAEHCPALSTLLLREGPIAPGVPFVDLVSPADVEQLQGCLKLAVGPAADAAGAADAAVSTGDAFAGLCHVRLRASNNVMLPASIFYSCVRDIDSNPAFLLGIREDHDGGAPEPPPSQLRDQVSGFSSVPEVSAVDVGSNSTWSSISENEDVGQKHWTPVWVDEASDTIRVLSCPPSFALLGGAGGPCNNLGDWMTQRQLLKICTLLDTEDHRSSAKVWLCAPAGPKYRCEVKLSSARASPALSDIEAAATQYARCLLFRVGEASMHERTDETRQALETWRSTVARRSGPLNRLRSQRDTAVGEAGQQAAERERRGASGVAAI